MSAVTKTVALAWIVFLLLACPGVAQEGRAQEEPTLSLYAEDFEAFWRFAEDNYAYFDARATDWAAVRAHFGARADTVQTTRALIGLLEEALAQLYDHHAHVGSNTATSPRLVPSGADLWAEWRGDKAYVVAVRAGSEAAESGIEAGQRIVAIGGQPVREAVADWLPTALRAPDDEARDWALRSALAGRQNTRVCVQLEGQASPRCYAPGRTARPNHPASLYMRADSIAVVRFHDSLGQRETVAAFDSLLVQADGARALVLDLRGTPGGGNTEVARGILGRLVTTPTPYQRHELPSEARQTGIRRLWAEYVAPRPEAGAPWTRPVFVWTSRWTGSMGEGLAIGARDAAGATLVGTPMAGLLGALYQTRLPNTGLVVRLPAEKLFDVQGVPREDTQPDVLVETPGEEALLRAVRARL